MEKYYCFAGVEISVHVDQDWMYDNDRTLAPFRVQQVTAPQHFYFTIVDAPTPPKGQCIAVMDNFLVYAQGDVLVRYTGAQNGDWKTAYMRTEHLGMEHLVELKSSVYVAGMSAKTVLNAIEAEHLIARSGGFVFHSSYIRLGDRAVLFTAPSGTGKSTQAELWRTLRNAEIINGDRSVVRIAECIPVADGLPYAGSSQICKKKTLPLAAIVYLKQAPQTTIRRLCGAEAFRRVWEGCSINIWDKEDIMLVSDTVQRVVMTVPVYELACTPDESAIIALEGVLMG
ncbi:MAG: hypothetical protein J6C37_07200 [Roseburia sp.]|nr:hypothetical protein [Roseburia sp.]